ncbi:hypothetical protein PLICRDRAFT_663122 [Plicaturopsis crispa FD-325 SS-3]|nr:hypothetical protein PLICRDRAFT_663122 [Plicaturopsis crispa FD-325 SS-3]
MRVERRLTGRRPAPGKSCGCITELWAAEVESPGVAGPMQVLRVVYRTIGKGHMEPIDEEDLGQRRTEGVPESSTKKRAPASYKCETTPRGPYGANRCERPRAKKGATYGGRDRRAAQRKERHPVDEHETSPRPCGANRYVGSKAKQGATNRGGYRSAVPRKERQLGGCETTQGAIWGQSMWKMQDEEGRDERRGEQRAVPSTEGKQDREAVASLDANLKGQSRNASCAGAGVSCDLSHTCRRTVPTQLEGAGTGRKATNASAIATVALAAS